MIARVAVVGLTVVNGLTVGLLLIPLVTSLLVSLTPSEFIALPTDRISLRWYEQFFGDFRWMSALMNTLTVAGLTMVISFPVGLLAALAFTRYHLRWRAVANTTIMLPLFVPAVILGIGSLTFHRTIGIWGTSLSLAVAHSLWAVPLVFVVLKSTLGGVDRSVEEAAAGLGANPLRVFWEITLPLIAPGVFVGLLFAFIISVNEFIMSLFLSTPRTRTLPVAIWPQIRYLLTPIVAAASSVIIVITLVILGVAAKLMNVRRLVEYR
ncbi:MAG: ABC transporter permease [Candidatus Rokubacteria bacterium]|nr:ABC transporter permease [Candidatus Rokubacteria bacterium]